MRILIDIDEDVRVAITRMGLLRIPDEMQKKVDTAIQRGTPISDNATNGDYVKAIMKAGMIHSVLFEENAKVDDEEFVCMYYEGKIIGDFDLTWWNAQYQKGGKE